MKNLAHTKIAEPKIDLELTNAAGEVPIPDATPEEEFFDALQDYHTTRFFAAARERAPRTGNSDEWGASDD